MHAVPSRQRRNALVDTDSDSKPAEKNTSTTSVSARSTPSTSHKYASMLERMKSFAAEEMTIESHVTTGNAAAAATSRQLPPVFQQGDKGADLLNPAEMCIFVLTSYHLLLLSFPAAITHRQCLLLPLFNM